MRLSTSIILLLATVYSTLAAPLIIRREDLVSSLHSWSMGTNDITRKLSDSHVHKRAEYAIGDLKHLSKREIDGERHLVARADNQSGRGRSRLRNLGTRVRSAANRVLGNLRNAVRRPPPAYSSPPPSRPPSPLPAYSHRPGSTEQRISAEAHPPSFRTNESPARSSGPSANIVITSRRNSQGSSRPNSSTSGEQARPNTSGGRRNSGGGGPARRNSI